MEALFFVSDRGAASGIRSQDDLPSDPVGAPLPLPSLGTLRALVSALGLEAESALTQLRDTTCQSFPIWALGPQLEAALTSLTDPQIDSVGEAWLENCGELEPDADLHEVTLLLADLRSALQQRDGTSEELFVLLEEKAL